MSSQAPWWLEALRTGLMQGGRSLRASSAPAGRKVIITIPHLAPWGTEAQTLRLAEVLVGAGKSVHVCCLYGHDPAVVSGFVAAGTTVECFDLRREDGLLALVRRLRAALRRERPHTLHVQYLTPGLPAVVAGRLAGVPRIFLTVNHSGAGYGFQQKALLRTAATLSTSVFCVSRAVEESWFGSSSLFGPDSVGPLPRHCTVYNAVTGPGADATTRDQVDARRAEFGVVGREVVGIVGRLTREKGHGTLLDAMPAIAGSRPAAVLLVVGSGPDETLLRERAATLGLGDRVVWAGNCPPEQLAATYAVMDVAVVPSLSEGFGLVAAEAGAAGRAVVASRTGGLGEVVADGETGLLVPPRDVTALASAVTMLLADLGKREALGAAARRRVADQFSFERYGRCIRAAYERQR